MSVDVTGVDDLLALLEQMRDAVSDLRPVLDIEADEIDRVIGTAWSARMSPGGDTWPSSGDGGSMRTAHSVSAATDSLTIRVAHDAASYVLWGTRHARPRNPLPVVHSEGVVSLDMRGRAGSLWRRHVSRVEAYLAGQDGDDIR